MRDVNEIAASITENYWPCESRASGCIEVDIAAALTAYGEQCRLEAYLDAERLTSYGGIPDQIVEAIAARRKEVCGE